MIKKHGASACLVMAFVLELLPGSVKLRFAPEPGRLVVQYASHIHPASGNLVFPPVTLALTVFALLAAGHLLWGRCSKSSDRLFSLILNGCAALSAIMLIVLQPENVCVLAVVIALLLSTALIFQLVSREN